MSDRPAPDPQTRSACRPPLPIEIGAAASTLAAEMPGEMSLEALLDRLAGIR